jgi:hypothetical protein
VTVIVRRQQNVLDRKTPAQIVDVPVWGRRRAAEVPTQPRREAAGAKGASDVDVLSCVEADRPQRTDLRLTGLLRLQEQEIRAGGCLGRHEPSLRIQMMSGP